MGASRHSLVPARKATRFMTNSPFMRDQLSLQCGKSHEHQQLVGGRCRDAAFYPLPLSEAILQGISRMAELVHSVIMSADFHSS